MVSVLTRPPKNWRNLSLEAKYRLRWRLTARENQLTPDDHILCTQPLEDCERALKAAEKVDPLQQVQFLRDNGHFDWEIWLLLMGRGGGKSRSGAEDCAEYAIEHPGHRIGLIGETFADVRDTMVEGESGLLSVLPSKRVLSWNRSIGELILTNGSRMDAFSAEKPKQLRGPNLHRLWCIATGTPVETARGPVPIQDVLPGDMVPTRQGWRRVLAARRTGTDWATVDVVTADG